MPESETLRYIFLKIMRVAWYAKQIDADFDVDLL